MRNPVTPALPLAHPPVEEPDPPHGAAACQIIEGSRNAVKVRRENRHPTHSASATNRILLRSECRKAHRARNTLVDEVNCFGFRGHLAWVYFGSGGPLVRIDRGTVRRRCCRRVDQGIARTVRFTAFAAQQNPVRCRCSMGRVAIFPAYFHSVAGSFDDSARGGAVRVVGILDWGMSKR